MYRKNSPKSILNFLLRKYGGKSDSANEAVLGGVRSGILDYELGGRGPAIVGMADWRVYPP
jgi:hypothetical protein